jgi:hypothetical protein
MNADGSILDRVIETQKKEEIQSFDLLEMLDKLLQVLPQRDRDIVKKRHGLLAENPSTLEEIGKKYNITRERVRQIEVTSVKLLRQQLKSEPEYQNAVAVVEEIIKEAGGVIEESVLMGKIKAKFPHRVSINAVSFFLNYLVKDNFTIIKNQDDLKLGWQLPDFDTSLLRQTLNKAVEVIKGLDKVVSLDEFFEQFKKTDFYESVKDKVDKRVFVSYLLLSKKLEENPFGDWGLKSWKLITPKRMNDKIYLVLWHHGKPLHFKEIANRINEVKFDGKRAHPATVHNELILDNRRYVLVGRGIYGLKEWGYQPGVVAEVITRILQKNGPLTKDEIIELVLKQRMVKKTTVVLALMNKEKFVKLSDGRYNLTTNDNQS